MTSPRRRLPSRMLLGRDRLFYGGLVGNAMKTRCLGAMAIYAARAREIGAEAWRSRRIVALAPNTPHRLNTRSGEIANLCLESESIDRDEMQSLIAEINAAEDERVIARIVDARRETASTS